MTGTPDTHAPAITRPQPTARPKFKAEKATKEQRKLRLALISYEGQGKTLTALKIATRICEREGGRILLGDTEGASSRIYADAFDFDMVELTDHSPDTYIDFVAYADAQGYRVLILDSFSHEYTGAGGVLEVVDVGKAKGGFGWDVATPKHRKALQAIVTSKLHVIATMRQKKAWIKEVDQRGKERLRLQGTEAVQREGTEYEFDMIGTIEDATLTVTKARDISGTIKAGQTFDRPGAELADLLIKLVSAGVAPKEQPAEDAAGIPDIEAPAGTPITEGARKILTEALAVVDPKRKDAARKAIAEAINAAGYLTWDAFLARGHEHYAPVLALIQGYDRSVHNGTAPTEAPKEAAPA
jgi:hypothetical protein